MAFAWPWGVYETVPQLWLPLSTLTGVFLLGICAVDAVRRRRLDIPFDLLWPALVWMLMAVIARMGGHRETSESVFTALVYLAAVYATRSRDTLANCLWLSMVSGACVAALTLFSRSGLLMPTAFLIDAQTIQETHARLSTRLFESPPMFAFAPTLSSGLCTLLVCGAIAIYAAVSRGVSRAARSFAVVAGLLVVSALMTNTLPALERIVEWRPLAGLRTSWPEVAASAVVLWLAVWIASRNATALRRERGSVFHPVVSGAIVAVAAWLALPFEVVPMHGFLLGVAAAFGLRDAPEPPRKPTQLWFASPIVLLALLNVWTVWPGNVADPRNYRTANIADIQQGNRETAFDRIAALRAFGVQERSLYLSQSQVALAYERPHWAAHSLGQSVRFAGPLRPLLPEPTQEDVQRLLAALREFTSNVTDADASLAQEVALAETGQTEAALSLLDSRARREPKLSLIETPHERAAEALAFLLGVPEVEQELSTWPHERLCATLDRIDARVEPVPEGFPNDLLPMIVAYRPSANGYAVRVWTKIRQVAAEVPMLWVAPHSPPPDASTVAWRQAAPIGSEWWRFTLSLQPRAQAIAVLVGKDGGVTIEANPLPLEALPDDAVVLILR